MVNIYSLWDDSISVGHGLGIVGTVESCWEHSDLVVAVILSPEAFGLLVVRQLHQEVEDIVSTCVSCLVVLSEAWVMVVIFHVGQSNLGIPVKMSLSLLAIGHVASEPFVESHCAHDVVIRHGVETVKGVLDFLLGTNSCLEWGGGSSRRKSLPIHQFFLFETPRFEGQLIDVFRLNELIFQVKSVEVEDLGVVICTLLVRRNQFLSWSFSHTASVLSL